MRGWLKDHIVEIVGLAVGGGGAYALWEQISSLASRDPGALLFLSVALIAAGAILGWNAHKWWDGRYGNGLYGLSPKQLLAIDRAIAEGGTVAVPCDSDIAREFQSLQSLGFANTPDNAPRGSYWFVSSAVTNAAREDDRFMGLLRDASFVGRFDDDGSFARYSTEEQEALRAAAE